MIKAAEETATVGIVAFGGIDALVAVTVAAVAAEEEMNMILDPATMEGD